MLRSSVASRQAGAKRSVRAAMTLADRRAELARSRRRQTHRLVDSIVDAAREHARKLPQISDRVVQDAVAQLSSAMKEYVCCVCDCFHPSADVHHVKLVPNSCLVNAMRSRLQPPANLPDALRRQYDVGDVFSPFRGILLSKKGVRVSAGTAKAQICSPCKRSLQNAKLGKPPKYAIANGLYIGVLPEAFADTTLTENAMLNLSQPMHYLSVVRGGKHSALRSHAYFFRADPAPPASLLPQDVVSTGIIGVTMVGALTPAQKAATRRKYDVRVTRLREQLDWYKRNNHLYAETDERSEWEGNLSSVCTRVVLDTGETSAEASGGEPNEGNGIRDSLHVLNPGAQLHCGEDVNAEAELDRSLWRHNAPTPAFLAPSVEDEVAEQTAVSLISDFDQIDGLSAIQNVLAKKNAVVYRSTGIISDFDKSYWLFAYGELFPFGRGGLDEPRSIAISLTEFIKYCLRLSSRKHSRHPSFGLVAFDVIARHHAVNALSIKAKMSPTLMERAGRVSREGLEEYSRYVQGRLSALKEQRPLPERPAIASELWDLYASLNVGMRAFWGSNEERSSSRTDLLSMQLKFGQPTLFFTLSPDCSTTFRVGALAGAFPDEVLRAIEGGIEDTVRYSRARLGEIATSNPYQCARYFDLVMKVFINVILNWNVDNGRARQEPGLFGHTKAFYCASESQSSTGSLHSHMLIWVDNMPRTVDEYYDMCGNDRFRSAMVQYVDAIASSNVPLDLRQCPACTTGEITALPMQQKAFKKPARGSERPAMSSCNHCGEVYGSDELIMRHCERTGSVMDNDQVLREVASFRPLTSPLNPTGKDAAAHAHALLLYQHHNWFHSRSCFKVTRRTPKGNVCRMFIPKEPCTETRWNEQNRIDLKRNVGNEYLNTYVPAINSIFKCNHDIKLLGAGEGPEKAYYMMKYATKDQQDIENPAALHLHAFDKSVDRFSGDRDDAVAVGRHRVQSMCCTLSNPQEVSAPMAYLYLMRGSVMYSSHKFASLNVPTFLNALFDRQEQVDVVLEEEENNQFFRASTLFHDYVSRPRAMDDVSLMQFVSQWERRKSKRGERFLHTHPQHSTHSLFKRSEAHVVVLRQKRLPDFRRQDLSQDERRRFQRTVMMLFQPFRAVSHLEENGVDLEQSYKTWWGRHKNSEAGVFVNNNGDYYASRELSRSQVDPDAARYGEYEGSDGEQAFDNVDSLSDDDDQDEPISMDMDDEFDAADFEIPSVPTMRHIDLLLKTKDVSGLAAHSVLGTALPSLVSVQMDAQDVESYIRSGHARGGQSDGEAVDSVANAFPDVQTRVRMLEEAIRTSDDMHHEASVNSRPETLREMPSLIEVSRAFELNEKQHKMFVKVGAQLLMSLLEQEVQLPQQHIKASLLSQQTVRPFISYSGGL